MRPSTEIRASIAAATSSVPAPIANTAPTPEVATSTPATSGPISVPRLSIVEVAPFEAMSSAGVRASDGRSA
jgi:hypothetical protein